NAGGAPILAGKTQTGLQGKGMPVGKGINAPVQANGRLDAGRKLPDQRPLDEITIETAEQLLRGIAAQVQVRQIVHEEPLRQAWGVTPSQRRKVRLKLLVSR